MFHHNSISVRPICPFDLLQGRAPSSVYVCHQKSAQQIYSTKKDSSLLYRRKKKTEVIKDIPFDTLKKPEIYRLIMTFGMSHSLPK